MGLQISPHMSIVTILTNKNNAERVTRVLGLVPRIKLYDVLLHVAATLLDQMDKKPEPFSNP